MLATSPPHLRSAFAEMCKITSTSIDIRQFLFNTLRRRPSREDENQMTILQGQQMIVRTMEEQERQLALKVGSKTDAPSEEKRISTGPSAHGPKGWIKVGKDRSPVRELPPSSPRQTSNVEDMATSPSNRNQADVVETKTDMEVAGQYDSPSGPATSTQVETPVPAATSEPIDQSEAYHKLAQVGEGTYGKVYKARSNTTGQLVALKRIRMEGEKDGFPVTAMREIRLLQGINHTNVIKLHEMMVSKGEVLLRFRCSMTPV
jgi:CTD kinase subunit alpha